MATEDVTSGGDLAPAYPLQAAPMPPSPRAVTHPRDRRHGFCLDGSAQGQLCAPENTLGASASRRVAPHPPAPAAGGGTPAAEDSLNSDLGGGTIGHGIHTQPGSTTGMQGLFGVVPPHPADVLCRPVAMTHECDGHQAIGLWSAPAPVPERPPDAPSGDEPTSSPAATSPSR